MVAHTKTLRTAVLTALGYAAAGLAGCSDNGAGHDDGVASRAAALLITSAACPVTVPLTDIFVTKMDVMIFDDQGRLTGPSSSSKNTPYRSFDFAGDGRPLCYNGLPFPLELAGILTRSKPARVYISLQGSIGECGLSPDEAVPILTSNRPGGPLLMADCGPNNSQTAPATCIIPPLTSADFNHCVH